MLKGDMVQALRSARDGTAFRPDARGRGPGRHRPAGRGPTGHATPAGGCQRHGQRGEPQLTAAAPRQHSTDALGRPAAPGLPHRVRALPAHPARCRAGGVVQQAHRPDVPALGWPGHAVHGQHREGRHHVPVAVALPVPARHRPGQHAVLHQVPAAEHDHDERQRGRDLAVLLLRRLHHAHPVQHAHPDPPHQVGCETPTYYGWGNTTTTARDQVAIVRTLAYRNATLDPARGSTACT